MKRQQVDQVEGMFAAGARQNASTPPASGNSNDQQTQSSLASVQNNGLDLSVDSQGNTMNHSVDTKEPFSIRAQLSNVLDNK